MSADKNLDAVLETGTVAQRTYGSLSASRGGARTEQPRDGRIVVSIEPMDERTYWQHDGRGEPFALKATYQKVDAPAEVP